MRRPSVKRSTRAEQAYIRELERTPAFELVDRGRGQVVPADQYPVPLKRFLARARTTIHVRLSSAIKRKLDARSQRTGLPVQELARRWIEQGIDRDAG